MIVMEIPGFPGYFATNDGRILSSHGMGVSKMGSQPVRELSGGVDAKGYRGVSLVQEGGKVISKRVHRLVAITFIPNPMNLPCVRHLNGDPSDNRVENLAWGTYRDNENDKISHGTWDNRRGGGKLTMENANAIRIARKMGWRAGDLSAHFEVSPSTIYRLLKGSIWK